MTSKNERVVVVVGAGAGAVAVKDLPEEERGRRNHLIRSIAKYIN